MYKLGPELGHGGFGVVYSGFRITDGLPVAVKLVSRATIAAWGTVSFVYMFVSVHKCVWVVFSYARRML